MSLLTVTMALDALKDAVSEVDSANEALRNAHRVRDDLIRDARDCGIGYRMLTRVTGLSRDRLWVIANNPRHEPSPYADPDPLASVFTPHKDESNR